MIAINLVYIDDRPAHGITHRINVVMRRIMALFGAANVYQTSDTLATASKETDPSDREYIH
jgi:hypothetical protein